jgi:hypothetical protein
VICNADGQVLATLIAGDGIGPEVTESVVEVLGKPFNLGYPARRGWRRSRRSRTTCLPPTFASSCVYSSIFGLK